MSEGREFAPDIVEPMSWKIKGIGMYGSDVDVVSLSAYQELATQYGYCKSACLMWARKCMELEGKPPGPVAAEPLRVLARALRMPLAAVLDAMNEDPRPTEEGTER